MVQCNTWGVLLSSSGRSISVQHKCVDIKPFYETTERSLRVYKTIYSECNQYTEQASKHLHLIPMFQQTTSVHALLVLTVKPGKCHKKGY